MTQDNQGQILNFQKKGRRKAIARMTKNYAAMLAHIMGQSVLEDGEHFDENDLPITRALDRTERRHGAVANAAIFFCGILTARSKFEHNSGRSDDMPSFAYAAGMRQRNYHVDNLGKYKILVGGRDKRNLQTLELEYCRAIMQALRIEAVNDPEFDEAEFWADVFRGMADADTSGVVLRAAGLVLLDHLPHFQQALALHARDK